MDNSSAAEAPDGIGKQLARRLLAAISFLTRVPAPSPWRFEGADVGRSTLFFPLVGAGLGLAQLAALRVFMLMPVGGGNSPTRLPPLLIAALLVALEEWLTGALHLDGLADMADGFGGGLSRDDVLRIMRDHAIGSYGALAVTLVIVIKVTALGALIEWSAAAPYLILAAALSRWASVPLGRFLPYARGDGGGLGAAVTDYVGWTELIGATVIAAAFALFLAGWRGAVCWLAVGVVALVIGRLCMRRVGGVTGDTLGAATELGEAAVLIVAVALAHQPGRPAW